MDTWFDEYVVAPLDELLDSVPIGDEVHDLERCEKLAIGLEGLFRTEAAAQYRGWPPESTTDGTRIDLCVRSDEDTLDVAGVAWIDFDGAVFPYRAAIRRTPDRSAFVTVYIAQVDPRTGEPPRMPEERSFWP